MRPYLELTKPRITWLILMSAGVGYFFGLPEGPLDWWRLIHALLGTALVASGTAALNQWWESEADSCMVRTRHRPIPSGRVTRRAALIFGLAISVLGLAELAAFVNALSSLLAFLAWASYLLFYTPLKKLSPHATSVGAIPGAVPPLIGYAAASGRLDAAAFALYILLFIWQFPHFYAIAWMYREDYARAGIRMLPVIESDGRLTARLILFYSALLIPVSLAPTFLSMSGGVYAAGALLMGVYFLHAGLRVRRDRSILRARGVLLASIVYLPALYGLMLLDRPGL
jgi:protoheme IX farnesyltransferase